MTESMIERVARAIEGANAQSKGLSFSELTQTMARAAIEAMRGLPPAMADAAYQRMLMGRCSTEEEARQLFAEGWQAAIDAALSE